MQIGGKTTTHCLCSHVWAKSISRGQNHAGGVGENHTELSGEKVGYKFNRKAMCDASWHHWAPLLWYPQVAAPVSQVCALESQGLGCPIPGNPIRDGQIQDSFNIDCYPFIQYMATTGVNKDSSAKTGSVMAGLILPLCNKISFFCALSCLWCNTSCSHLMFCIDFLWQFRGFDWQYLLYYNDLTCTDWKHWSLSASNLLQVQTVLKVGWCLINR